MRIRFNILLIISSFFLCTIGQLKANSVSGIYAFPQNSVKYEKLNDFSILPIGWSKTGNVAFIIVDRSNEETMESPTMGITIINSIEDTLLWNSPEYELKMKSLSSIWNSNVDLFSDKLAEFEIIPDKDPVYGGTDFILGDDHFALNHEEINQTGQNGIFNLQLKIKSDKRGEKTLYKYISNRDTENILIDFQVLGYFKSPWEDRVMVVSAEDYLSSNNSSSLKLRFSGAHMTIGYRKEVTNENQLIDAVLSGQYYNSRNLLQKGADPDSKVVGGEPLILMAARQFNWDLVYLLYEFNASIAVIDKDKRTLLHYAVLEGNLDAVKTLLLWGINKNFHDLNGDTALTIAKRLNHMEIIGLIQ